MNATALLIDISAYREKFLDNFPLSESEVDRLILLYNSTCEEATTCLAQLQANITTDEEQEEEECWSNLKHIENTVLPDILQWLTREAPQLVSPLLPYDIRDDPSSPLCRAFSFLEATVSLMGRRGTRFLTSFVYELATKQNGDEGATPEALVDLMYKHLMAALYLQGEKVTLESSDPPKAWVLSLIQSAGSDTTISKSAWATWINNVLPESMRGLSTFYLQALLGPRKSNGPNSPPPLTLPHPDQEPLFWDSRNLLLPLSLSCISPVWNGHWHRIYSSDTDGSSFLSFHQALLSYSGPTALLIRPRGNNPVVFGYYTDCPWRDSPTWQGGEGHDSFLFQVSEDSLGVYWPTYTGACYMYLNTAPLHNNGMNGINNSNTLRGLAIGGMNCETPRVHLTTSLENCKATSTDTTYTSGPLLDDDSSFFDVDAMEVWAVNVTDEEFLQNQSAGRAQLARKEQARQNFAKVDRAQFLDDFQSGAYMNNLYGHREQARGRHDFVASVTGNGYFLEGKPPSVRNLQEHAISKRKSWRKSNDISKDALPGTEQEGK